MKDLSSIVLVLAVLVALVNSGGAAQAQPGADHEADFKRLTLGVESLHPVGVPGQVCVIGPDAFAVMTGKSRDHRSAVVAAGSLGAGRVVVFGHDGYLGDQLREDANWRRLMDNALAWTSMMVDEPVVGDLRRRKTKTPLAASSHRLERQGLKAVFDGGPGKGESGINVLVLDAGALQNDETAEQLVKWVQAGGGVITAATGWGWQQLNPGVSLGEDFPLNTFLHRVGLAIGPQVVSPMGVNGAVGYTVGDKVDRWLNASSVVYALEHEQFIAKADRLTAAACVGDALRSISLFDETGLDQSLEDLEAGVRKQPNGRRYPTPDQPMPSDDVQARVLIEWDFYRYSLNGWTRGTGHPAAYAFPGGPGAERVTARIDTTVRIRPGREGWVSTGLYAEPGQAIMLRLPASFKGSKPSVRIGCHKDDISHKPEWRRLPRISIIEPWGDGKDLEIQSPFGGLVYLQMPKGGFHDQQEIGVWNVIRAPLYVHGQTDLRQWQETIRNAPGPWAELASDKVVITVPSDFVRELDRPDELMTFWNRVSDAAADLASMPQERSKPHRFVADVQISAGYMHAGYPIMTHLDAAPRMVDLEALKAGAWGLYHELGHNHQSPDWTFKGTGEVTCNLFSLYIIETLCDVQGPGHPAMAEGKRRKRLRAYLENGAVFEAWKQDPFLALTMYAQIQEAFGWQPIKDAIASYQALNDKQRPRSEAEKRDQWLIRISKATGHDLGPFFEAWGVPTSLAARAQIRGLSEWMPQELVDRRGR